MTLLPDLPPAAPDPNAQDARDVELALSIDSGLSDWEVGFLESLYVQVVEEGRTLSDRQREKLDEILSDYDL